MDSPKYSATLLLFIVTIPIFYFLTINDNTTSSSATTDKSNTSKNSKSFVGRETRESSTQTLSELDTLAEETVVVEVKTPESSNISDIKLQEEEEMCEVDHDDDDNNKPQIIQPDSQQCEAKTPESHPTKRILDYFAYIVTGQ
jgi:hypothetical protein